jgi:hypothetical protein
LATFNTVQTPAWPSGEPSDLSGLDSDSPSWLLAIFPFGSAHFAMFEYFVSIAFHLLINANY